MELRALSGGNPVDSPVDSGGRTPPGLRAAIPGSSSLREGRACLAKMRATTSGARSIPSMHPNQRLTLSGSSPSIDKDLANGERGLILQSARMSLEASSRPRWQEVPPPDFECVKQGTKAQTPLVCFGTIHAVW